MARSPLRRLRAEACGIDRPLCPHRFEAGWQAPAWTAPLFAPATAPTFTR